MAINSNGDPMSIPNHEDFLKAMVEGAPQDVSLPILQDLLEQGYTDTRWQTAPSSMDIPCLSKNGETKPLAEFLTGTQHNAPIYSPPSGTHVGCKCGVLVTGDGLPDVFVTAFGIQP